MRSTAKRRDGCTQATGAAALPHAVHTGTALARCATQGYAVSENVYEAGHCSHHHAHESPFIGSALSGVALARPQNELCTPGEVNFSPAGRPHSHVVAEGGLRGLTIDILPHYAAGFVECGADFNRYFAVNDPDVFRLITRLHREIHDPDPLSLLLVDALIVEICVSLMRLGRGDESTSVPRWLKRIVRRVDECYRENLTLDELAADAAVHPVHVSRAFRRCFGETLGGYIRRLRIKEARRLLEIGSGSVAQIAVDVGYHDESHLARAFKKIVGTSPGNYRRVVQATSHLTARG